MTHNPSGADKKILQPSADGGFRLAVIIFTAFIFAAAFGWLACMERKETGEVEFHWQWRALVWIAIGIMCAVYFWCQVWPVRHDSPDGARKRMMKGWAALLIPSLMWMAYPLLFVSGPQLLNVFIGLTIAATTLTFGGWMIFRLVKGFANEETPDGGHSTSGSNPANVPAKQQANPPPPV